MQSIGENTFMLPPNLKILRQFGRVPLTGRHFMSAMTAIRGELIVSTEVERGSYYYANGKHHIIIPSRQRRDQKLITAWHEFSHLLQNFTEPKTAVGFCCLDNDAPGERLAQVFSAIACTPQYIRITGPMDFVAMIMRTKL